MTLATLKTKLQTLTGTSIGQVFFDWKIYSDNNTIRTFPVVVWNLDGAKAVGDKRTTTIQKDKIFTITVFAINVLSIDGDKITAWDTLEGYFDTYLNAMNNTAGIQILNIDNIQCQYLGQDVDGGEITIGIMFEGIKIKCFC